MRNRLHVILAIVAAAASCQLVSGVDSLKIDESLTVGGSGGATSASASGAASSTGSGGCETADACPGVDALCRARTCSDGACGFGFLPQGEPSLSNRPGDCSALRCGASGAVMKVEDDEDTYDDGYECTVDDCEAGMPTHTPTAAGADCEGSKYCNGDVGCVECLLDDHCADGVCRSERCVPAACADAQKNGSETDIDCGGPACGPCPDYKSCDVDADCASRVCLQGTKICDAPTCTDAALNGQETDVDCGGASCAKRCGDGAACRYHGDCVSGVCAGKLCAGPSCVDAVMNGAETGVDCGGDCGACP